jgi:hypothetical protein
MQQLAAWELWELLRLHSSSKARVILSLAVGFGLPALLFCSSRKGYDEPRVLIISENDSNQKSITEE